MAKKPVKAYLRIVYNDFSIEEQEITLEAARQIGENDSCVDIDVSQCSKRIGNLIIMLSLVTDDYVASNSKATGTSSFSLFKKRVNNAIRDIANYRNVTGPTIEDQLCRQCQQNKDELVGRVVDFFDAARNDNYENLFENSESMYRYMVDNEFTSDKVRNFDEAAFMYQKFKELAGRIKNAE